MDAAWVTLSLAVYGVLSQEVGAHPPRRQPATLRAQPATPACPACNPHVPSLRPHVPSLRPHVPCNLSLQPLRAQPATPRIQVGATIEAADCELLARQERDP